MSNTSIFFFRETRMQGVKVSHNLAVGLPSLTGIVGLGGMFAAKLAQSMGFKPTDLVCRGVLFAIEDYVKAPGFKKGRKADKKFENEAIPAVWANFTAHVAFEVEATEPALQEVLNQNQLHQKAKEVLQQLSFCKGNITHVNKAIDLSKPTLAGLGSARDRVLALLPSNSLVISDASNIVYEMRTRSIPLMDGFVAATMPHANRPKRLQEFFETAGQAPDQTDASAWKLVPVQDGYEVLDTEGLGNAVRADFSGNQGKSFVATPTLGLVRLQKAASIRFQGRESSPTIPFWSMQTTGAFHYCTIY
ncbi:hypothetical protein LC612_33380 [Nostoc sp. CHAB 5834]|nr:hypothetical protein [Nostoc sp. CHAB 5834]